MSGPPGVRRLLLDSCPGERRGVVLLDGRPEHLLIERDGEAADAPLGARLIGRVRAWSGDRAFVDLPTGPAGLLRAPAGVRPPEGAAIEVEVAAEASSDKGARLRLLGAGEGPPRALAPPPAIRERLAALAPGAAIEGGAAARDAADLAEETALATAHAFRGGLRLSVEPTRALVAIDVDLAAGEAASRGRVKEANLSALRHAVRLLRLKVLGGTAAIDLVGFPEPALRALYRSEAARALAPDGPDADALAPDAFGLLVLIRPRGQAPVATRLAGPRAAAQRLIRLLERELRADPGSFPAAVAPPEVAEELRPWLAELGPRARLRVAASAVAPHVSPQ